MLARKAGYGPSTTRTRDTYLVYTDETVDEGRVNTCHSPMMVLVHILRTWSLGVLDESLQCVLQCLDGRHSWEKR